jgi:hypothetical protein
MCDVFLWCIEFKKGVPKSVLHSHGHQQKPWAPTNRE